jgi:hypothetical protein
MDEFLIAKFTCEPNLQHKRPVPVAEKSLLAGKKSRRISEAWSKIVDFCPKSANPQVEAGNSAEILRNYWKQSSKEPFGERFR